MILFHRVCQWRFIYSVSLVLFFLVACAHHESNIFFTSESTIEWPSAPEQPRIRYINSFSQAKDLGLGKRFWQRVGEVFAGALESRLIRPMDVVSMSDVLYVADPGAKGVHRFDLVKGRYDLIRQEDDTPLLSPVGLAASPNGDVYVADSAFAQIFVIQSQSKDAVPVSFQAELRQPTALTLDSEAERFYIVDTGDHQVKMFDVKGNLLAAFGQRGSGDGEFNYLTNIWRDRNGRIFVVDAMNFRIQIFDANGKFLGKLGQAGDVSGMLSRPKGVATDSFGHIYIVDALFHAVQIFDESGNFLLSFGNQGQGPGEFWLPTGIFIDDDNLIYVADSYNQRIQIFRYIGEE